MSITLSLKPEQEKLFKKLEAAYKACQKSGIMLVNNYGSIEGYDKEFVQGYADHSIYNEQDEDVLNSHDVWCSSNFNIVQEWTDDTHLIKLTPKGKKKFGKNKAI